MIELADLPGRLQRGIAIDADGCWLWQEHLVSGVYGGIKYGGHEQRVHRLVWRLAHGSVPRLLDHECHNRDASCQGGECKHRRCCNPAHMRAASHRENVLAGRGLAAQQVTRDRCPAGHPYDEANTYVLPSRPTARYCRECNRQQKRERRARGRAHAD